MSWQRRTGILWNFLPLYQLTHVGSFVAEEAAIVVLPKIPISALSRPGAGNGMRDDQSKVTDEDTDTMIHYDTRVGTCSHIHHHIQDEHIGSRKKSHQFSERIAYQLHWNWLHASGIPRSLGWMTVRCLWVTDCSLLVCESQCDATSQHTGYVLSGETHCWNLRAKTADHWFLGIPWWRHEQLARALQVTVSRDAFLGLKAFRTVVLPVQNASKSKEGLRAQRTRDQAAVIQTNNYNPNLQAKNPRQKQHRGSHVPWYSMFQKQEVSPRLTVNWVSPSF